MSRPGFLSALRAVVGPVRHAVTNRRSPRYFRAMETLESRQLLTVALPDVPASSSLAITPGGHSATFTDVDGDHVTVAVSTGVLTLANFTMNTVSNLHDQLQTLDLTTGGFAGTSVTISVVKAGAGDGLTNVGLINAPGIDVGAVKVTGDLGRILVGDAHTSTSALTSLSVTSMGREGLDSQGVSGSIESDILGNVGSITVTKDIKDAHLNIETAGDGVKANLGTVAVGGSLIGGEEDRSARIDVDGNIGVAKITGDVLGGLGGTSGGIVAQGSFTSVTIGGSVIGDNIQSGNVYSNDGQMGTITVGGNVIGGSGPYSAYLGAYHNAAKKITIGGSLIGGSGRTSGVIRGANSATVLAIGGDVVGATAADGAIRVDSFASLTVGGDVDSIIETNGGMGPVKIGGNMLGTLATDGGPMGDLTIGGSVGGSISSDTTIGKITIAGDVNAPIAADSAITSLTVGGDVNALVSSGTVLGTTKITGDLLGTLSASTMTAVSIAGSVTGATIDANAVGTFAISGKTDSTGQFNITGSLGTFTVARSFGGSLAAHSATSMKVGGNLTGDLYVKTTAGTITIGGSLIGATNVDTGHVGVGGALGAVKVGGSLLGGAGANSGAVIVAALGTATVNGSVVGGSAFQTGEIHVAGSASGITVLQNIRGGASSDSGMVYAQTAKTITVGGSIIGGGASTSGLVQGGNSLGTVTIGKSVIGGSDFSSGVVGHSGVVMCYNSIGSVIIGGSIIAGQSGGGGQVVNSGAVMAGGELGSLTVKGSLIGNDGGAGHVTTVIISGGGEAQPGAAIDVAIGSVTIGGRVELASILGGYDSSGDAVDGGAQIGAVKIAGDFIASSIAAGVQNIPSSDASFGDDNDTLIPMGDTAATASIASVIIGGNVLGTPQSNSSSDHFGIVAQLVSAVNINGVSLTLVAGADNDNLALGPNGDANLHEV